MTDYGIDLNGASKSLDHGTMLWEIELGGCVTISVSARNHVQALVIAAEGDHLDGMPWDDDLTVSHISEEAARKAQFWDEDTGARRSLWDQWKIDTKPGLIGCSEF